MHCLPALTSADSTANFIRVHKNNADVEMPRFCANLFQDVICYFHYETVSLSSAIIKLPFCLFRELLDLQLTVNRVIYIKNFFIYSESMFSNILVLMFFLSRFFPLGPLHVFKSRLSHPRCYFLHPRISRPSIFFLFFLLFFFFQAVTIP